MLLLPLVNQSTERKRRRQKTLKRTSPFVFATPTKPNVAPLVLLFFCKILSWRSRNPVRVIFFLLPPMFPPCLPRSKLHTSHPLAPLWKPPHQIRHIETLPGKTRVKTNQQGRERTKRKKKTEKTNPERKKKKEEDIIESWRLKDTNDEGRFSKWPLPFGHPGRLKRGFSPLHHFGDEAGDGGGGLVWVQLGKQVADIVCCASLFPRDESKKPSATTTTTTTKKESPQSQRASGFRSYCSCVC